MTAIERMRGWKGAAGTACGRNGITNWSRFVPVAEALSRLVPHSDSRGILLIRHDFAAPKEASMRIWKQVILRSLGVAAAVSLLTGAASAQPKSAPFKP